MERYIVVGGGLAGLTAANALAGDGREVVLLERSEHLGGRATTQEDRGYSLNLGPHALYQGGVAARTLRRWGVPFQGNPPDTSAASYASAGKPATAIPPFPPFASPSAPPPARAATDPHRFRDAGARPSTRPAPAAPRSS